MPSFAETYPFRVKIHKDDDGLHRRWVGQYGGRPQFDWCFDTFDDVHDWSCDGCYFYFKNEQDFVLYNMRWQ